jgi:hypothetical protein
MLRLLKRFWLSPEVSVGKNMIELTLRMGKNNYSLFNMVFHSSSLKAGLSPYSKPIGDETRFIQRIKEFLVFAREKGIESVRLSEAQGLV